MKKRICLLFVFLFSFSIGNIVNDDNYILFSNTVNGDYSLPSIDGNLYLVGTYMSKIDLADRSISLVMAITLPGGTPVDLAIGALSGDGTRIIASTYESGGPNCIPYLVFDTSTLNLLAENCYGHTQDSVFAPLVN